MKPVDQTIFGAPHGNCLAACVASLLEVSIEDVVIDGDDKRWWTSLCEWLRPRGLYPLCFRIADAPDERPPGLHILAGKSPRGDFLHAVVAEVAEPVGRKPALRLVSTCEDASCATCRGGEPCH